MYNSLIVCIIIGRNVRFGRNVRTPPNFETEHMTWQWSFLVVVARHEVHSIAAECEQARTQLRVWLFGIRRSEGDVKRPLLHDFISHLLDLKSIDEQDKTPAMHRAIFRLQLANNRHLIENFPPPFFLIFFLFFHYQISWIFVIIPSSSVKRNFKILVTKIVESLSYLPILVTWLS